MDNLNLQPNEGIILQNEKITYAPNKKPIMENLC